MTKKIEQQVDDIIEELYELQVDQHQFFRRDESKGRERMAFLLLKWNALEEDKIIALRVLEQNRKLK